MTRRVTQALAVIGFAIAFAGGPEGPPLRAQSSTAESAAEAFKATLLAALASGNPRQIAGLVKYPIRVNHGMVGYPIPVGNAAAMIEMHRLFFTPEMRCAIEDSRIPRPGQPPPRTPMLVANGVVTLADGRVVAERTPAGFRITRLSVIGNPAGNAKPKEVFFRYGEGELLYPGRIAGDGADGYIVAAKTGALLQGKLEKFPTGSLQMRVTDLQTGMVLKGAPTELSRLWAARVPADGRYRLDIIRRAEYCDPAITYLLTIGLRR
jgi:hypothetical protein